MGLVLLGQLIWGMCCPCLEPFLRRKGLDSHQSYCVRSSGAYQERCCEGGRERRGRRGTSSPSQLSASMHILFAVCLTLTPFTACMFTENQMYFSTRTFPAFILFSRVADTPHTFGCYI